MLQVLCPHYLYYSLNINYEGGVCVLPLTMREALRFFEMDMMLSVKERETSQMLSPLVYYFYYINYAISCVVLFQFYWQHDLSHFRDSPYENEDSFQSSYIKDFTLVRTTSVKR